MRHCRWYVALFVVCGLLAEAEADARPKDSKQVRAIAQKFPNLRLLLKHEATLAFEVRCVDTHSVIHCPPDRKTPAQLPSSIIDDFVNMKSGAFDQIYCSRLTSPLVPKLNRGPKPSRRFQCEGTSSEEEGLWELRFSCNKVEGMGVECSLVATTHNGDESHSLTYRYVLQGHKSSTSIVGDRVTVEHRDWE